MRPAKNAHLTSVFLVLAAALFGLGTMNLAGAPGNADGPTNSNLRLTSTREYAVQSGVRPMPPARQMRASQRWEWEQRANPLGYIPEGAFPRAREQTRAADRIDGPIPKLLGVGQAGVVFFFVGPAPIDHGQTTPPGPVSGRITDIAVAPDDPNHWPSGIKNDEKNEEHSIQH